MKDDLQDQLRHDVDALCAIGPRALSLGTLDAARDMLIGRVGAAWHIDLQRFDTPDGTATNLELRHPDAPADPNGPVLLVGAHYDTWRDTPGADDNASAVACLLHMLEALRDATADGRLRFALYANEEPPYFQTPHMGSLHHARHCRSRGWDVEMLCLESLGYYDDGPGSQEDPSAGMNPLVLAGAAKLLGLSRTPSDGLLGDVGDFLVLEADLPSAKLLRRLRDGYARPPHPEVPMVRLIPAALPQRFCTGLSDHWSYWQHNFPAVMATDTALYRNPNYHRPGDLPDTLDYPRLAGVTRRLTAAVRRAAGGGA